MYKHFLMLLLFVKIISCEPTEIPIGAIFHDDTYELENAFRASIQNINEKEIDKINSVQFVPIIKYIPSTNSFKAERAVCELISLGVAAIFGPHTEQTTGIVKSICHHMKIPHIIAHWAPEPIRHIYNNKNMTVNLYPDSNTLARAIAEIVIDNNWSGYTIMYETDEGLMKLKDVLQIRANPERPTTIRRLGSESKNYVILKNIRESRSSDILLDCNLNDILNILKQAKYLGLLGTYERYLLTSLDTHILDFQEVHLENSNMTTFRLFSPDDWRELESEADDNNYKIFTHTARTEAALIYDAVQMFAEAYRKTNKEDNIELKKLNCKSNQEWQHGERIIDNIKMKHLKGAITGPILIDSDGNRINFKLDIIQLFKTGFKEIGYWTPSTGVNVVMSQDETLEKAKETLQSKTIIVASKTGEPFLMKRVPKEGEHLLGNDRYKGYSLDLVEALSEVLNFTYEFQLVDDNQFGTLNPITKEWNGVVKSVMDRKADIGVCDLTITFERRQAVDFTMPFMTLGITILYKSREQKVIELFSFMSPLSMEVWLYTVSSYLVLTVLLFILARMAPDEWINPHPCNTENDTVENIWNFKNCSWVMIAFLMCQGSDMLPKSMSTRIACGMWYFFALIMLSSYTANLAAFLTNDRMGSTIDNVEELANQNSVKYGVFEKGSTKSFFEHSNNSLFQKIWSTMENEKPSVFTDGNIEGAERVAKSKMKYAFFMESSVLEYMIEQNCDLIKVGGTLDSKEYGIALPMNSAFRKEFNRGILMLTEHGKLVELKKKWWRNKETGATCTAHKKVVTDTPELGVANVAGVFLVLVIGCICGLFIGVMEFLWNVRKVAVEEKLTPWTALTEELKFAVKIHIKSKLVHRRLSLDSEEDFSRSIRSTAQRSIHSSIR